MSLKQRSVDRTFIIIAGLLDFFMFIISSNSFDKMGDDCTSTVIYDGMVAVMTISAILATLAVSYLLCNMSSECYNENKTSEVSEIYLTITSSISFILMILLAVMGGKLPKDEGCNTKNPNVNSLKVNIWFMFSIALITFIAGSVGIYYTTEYIPKQYLEPVKAGKVEPLAPSVLDKYAGAGIGGGFGGGFGGFNWPRVPT